MQTKTLLRLPQVIERVGLRRSSIYACVSAGTFPPPIKISLRAVAWDSVLIERWIHERTETSKGVRP